MHVPTGRYTEATDVADAARKLGAALDEVVMVQGDLAQVKALSQRVRLGNAELTRRKARRAMQRKSRARNR